MQGLNISAVHPLTKDAVIKLLEMTYDKGLYDIGQIEDIVLFTEKRSEYQSIGTDMMDLDNMKYMCDNIFWINICLYVNADFRACFNDAITIEKALMQVNDVEYQDFRDDMTLDDDDGKVHKNFPIELSSYNGNVEAALTNMLKKARNDFFNAGMTDVYEDLSKGFDSKSAQEIAYVIHNMVYVINAFNRNGVFRKYVTLVVDSVRKQLN